MPTELLVRAAGGLAGLVLIAACGGGGLSVEGPEAAALFQRFSGSWVLDREASDEPADRADQQLGPGQRPTAGGRDGMGGRGGMRPGGMGGRGGMRGGPGMVDPEAMRATMWLAGQRADRLELTLGDSIFAATPSPGRPLVLPMSGDEVDLPGQDVAIEARLQWDGLVPEVEREIHEGGTIVDRYELLDEDRLLVTRRIDMGRGAGPELQFVYDRAAND